MKKKIIAILTLVLLLAGCISSTDVLFETNVDGAQVIIDGQVVGETPATVEMTNAVWEEQSVVIQKDGFKDLHPTLEKEPKVFNIVMGLIGFLPSYLYCYGPVGYQYNELMPE